MRKIVIIVMYFGRFPEYFHHFLSGCVFNRQIDWILFTDQDKLAYSGGNIHYNYLDISNFNHLAAEKLEFPVNIINAYKLCDFKPLYGFIFKDFLKDYNYWGYCDVDLVFGNFNVFLTDDISQFGTSITLEPGQEFYVSYDFQIFNDPCPGCIAQLITGLGKSGSHGEWCAYDGVPGIFPGTSGSENTTLIAPSTPGSYPVIVEYHWQYSCADALALYGSRGAVSPQVIGQVIVP